MKINYLNDWAIELKDINIAEADQSTALEIARLIQQNQICFGNKIMIKIQKIADKVKK